MKNGINNGNQLSSMSSISIDNIINNEIINNNEMKANGVINE
jgi:hypothetical protein